MNLMQILNDLSEKEFRDKFESDVGLQLQVYDYLKKLRLDKAKDLKVEVVTIDKYKNIKFIYGADKERKKYVYKYLPLSRLLDIHKTQTIGFVYPELWNDPYEILYLKTNFSAFGFDNKNKIYSLCLSRSYENEEAAWKIYSNHLEPTIRCKINYDVLLTILDDFANQNDCNVYISKINYALTQKEIRNIKNPSEYYDVLFDNFKEENYIAIMSLKRNAYKYENELRVFVVPKNNNCNENISKDNEHILNINLKNKELQSLFNQFTINPYPNYRDIGFMAPINEMKDKIEVVEVKKLIKIIWPNIETTESRLYKSRLPVGEIKKHKQNLKNRK